MTNPSADGGKKPDLDMQAAALVVSVQGLWTPDTVERFRASLARRGLAPTEGEVLAALERARQLFFAGEVRLFLCHGRPCRERVRFDASEQTLRNLEAECALPISLTECQGPCKQAPVATLRVGQCCEMFSQFTKPADWQTVLDFAMRAATAGTLLINQGEAQPFRFDPVHVHKKLNPVLQRLQFLLGQFRGEGQYMNAPGYFHKEMVGSLEMGGQFLSLRMGVAYPLADGRKDIHEALVMVGVNPATSQLEGRAYTDGGFVHDYQLELQNDGVLFADKIPRHVVGVTHARKILQPTPDGFEERLEVGRETGHFEPYSVIAMHRVRGH
jgi:hypothetical protein